MTIRKKISETDKADEATRFKLVRIHYPEEFVLFLVVLIH